MQPHPSRNVSRMPPWIRQNLGHQAGFGPTRSAIRDHRLHTVCEEARCPNRGECWSRGTATFMLLGDTCTRACAFCSVRSGRPTWFDRNEPARVAAAASALGLRYVVLTSVNRDDLEDGGAWVFAESLRLLRGHRADIGVELLTPDFRNLQDEALAIIMTAVRSHPVAPSAVPLPDLVWGHNVETVPRLYGLARRGSDYERSLGLLRKVARQPGVEAKSALMLGLGETRAEVLGVFEDLRRAGVTRLSLGQYLRPAPDNLPVAEYVHPEVFAEFEESARALGFTWVKAGPLVRSSYFAEEMQERRS